MTPEENTKQKIIALATVVVLFSIVGIILWSISLNNKNRTEDLKTRVLQLKHLREINEKLEKVTATSTLPDISARAYLTIAVSDTGKQKILMQKNPGWALPIASVTKLMVAVVTLENVSLDTVVTATLDYIGKEESAFVLETGKKYSVRELLANALIASDNDSARLLSSTLGENNFVAKMNKKAEELYLTKTNFFNVTGLDPKAPDLNANLSSPEDLATLLIYIKANHPEILQLTENKTYNFCDINNFCKGITSTNKLLENPDFKYKIIGGKTGTTDLAGKNLVLMAELEPGISIINIILGAKDNFADTMSLINNIIIN